MDTNGGEHYDARLKRAVGMVRVQADCTIEKAFVLLHERATMARLTMEEIVDAVLEGLIRFDQGSTSRPDA